MPTNRNHIGSHARNAVSEIQLEAQSLTQQAQERMHELSEAARERAVGLQHQAEERITENPLKAVLIAAGVGVVLGLFFRR